MYKLISILAIIIISNLLYAQNVGINNSKPVHDLDINGDVNITGALLVQGEEGEAGESLQSNGDGTMGWQEVGNASSATLCDYGNIISFRFSKTWIVPADVEEISFEMWGGGGRGGSGGGGGSGSYLRNKISVSPGASIAFYVGAKGSISSINGGSTYFTYGGRTYKAGGGYGGSTSNSGLGSYISTVSSTAHGYPVAGNSGHPTTKIYNQITDSEYSLVTHYGDGACAPFRSNGGSGKESIYNTIDNSTYSSQGRYGRTPGGGGGAPSSDGGQGLIIIYYN